MAWTLEIMRGLDSPQASLGTATALPCSPPSIIFTSSVLFLFDLTECIILHLFACLFPVFSMAINALRRDHSCVIHHCGQFLNSVQHTQTHYILSKYLLNNGTNQFCDSFMYSNNMDALTRTRTLIFRRKGWFLPYFWKTWLWGWCLKMSGVSASEPRLQVTSAGSLRGREKAVPAEHVFCSGCRPRSVNQDLLLSLKVSFALCQPQSAQMVPNFLEKEGNFSITFAQIAPVALHQGCVSHSLDQIQGRNGRNRSFWHRDFQ